MVGKESSFPSEIEPSIERVIFKNSRGLSLVGDFYHANSKYNSFKNILNLF